MFKVTKEMYFSASHHLRNYNGKCERIHGHNWRVLVTATGSKLDNGGMLIDFHLLKDAMKKVIDKLDHNDLNQVAPFDKIEPSAENIAKYICDEVGLMLNNECVTISKVSIWETTTSRADYIKD